MVVQYEINGSTIRKVILDYETTTISLPVSEDPIRFGPVVTNKEGCL